MPRITVSNKDGRSTILVSGDFTFEINREFRDAYQALPQKRPVTVDLSRANYLDSAGLGMLLRLREHAGGEKKSVTIAGSNPTIRTILDVANFGQLFTLV